MQGRTLLVVAAAAAAIVVTGRPAARAADPPSIVVQNGETQDAFGYTDAIRERVWVDSDFDSDGDGVNDRIAVDIMRPAATDAGSGRTRSRSVARSSRC